MCREVGRACGIFTSANLPCNSPLPHLLERLVSLEVAKTDHNSVCVLYMNAYTWGYDGEFSNKLARPWSLRQTQKKKNLY